MFSDWLKKKRKAIYLGKKKEIRVKESAWIRKTNLKGVKRIKKKISRTKASKPETKTIKNGIGAGTIK